MKKDVPFYSNTADDTHCFQAALKMVLKYFLPNNEYSFDQLDEMTAKKEGLWTWPMQGMINLQKLGFEIIDKDDFDLKRFSEIGESYLVEKYGDEVGNRQIEKSDINQEIRLAKEYELFGLHVKEIPDLDQIKQKIDDGFLVICNVNAYAMNGKKGYAGHFVVLFDYDHEGVILHDPGLPPVQNRKVSFEDFRKGWEYPDEESRNFTALRLIKE